MSMRCPRKGCKNNAEIHPLYGVLPCKACQQVGADIRAGRKFEFANVSKSNRIQVQRDKFAGDMLQPFIGNKPNQEFFERYPEKVNVYGVRDELKKL